MLKIKSVTIKGMHNVDLKHYDINDITYFNGPNGSGKSTVLQAIQYALLGYIPGTNKRTSSIFEHANNDMLSVKLILDDDGTLISIERSMRESLNKRSVETSLVIDPDTYDIASIISDIELPIFNFDEFLNMTPNKMKEWFVRFLPKYDVAIDWKSEMVSYLLSKGITDVNARLVDEAYSIISTIDGDDCIKEVNDKLKSELSSMKKEKERLQSTIQSLIYYDDVDDTLDASEIRHELDVIKKRIHDNDILRAKYQYVKVNNDGVDAALAEFSDFKKETFSEDENYKKFLKKLRSTEKSIKECTDRFEQCVSEQQSIREAITKLESEINFKSEILEGKGVCPYTNVHCNDVSKILDSYREDIEDAESTKASLEQDLNDSKVYAEIEAENRNKLKDSKRDYETMLASIEKRYKERDSLRSRYLEYPEYDPNFDADSENQLVQSLNDTLIKLSANEQYQKMIDKLTADKFELDTSIEYYKHWVNMTGVNGMQTDTSSKSPFYILGDTMDSYITKFFGESCCSDFGLSEKSNSFSLYLNRDDIIIPFNLLSSGEKCMYSLALMLSLVQLSDCKLKLVLVDDLLDHLDDENIKIIFNTLESVKDIQMIFAGVKKLDKSYVVNV